MNDRIPIRNAAPSAAPGVEKPRLVIVGSARAQQLTSSPLLRLVRDFSPTLSMYDVHAIAETADAILGTGMYDGASVTRHRAGDNGGITQLAAMLARREVAAAILFLDPNDPWSDAVENRALIRVCIHRQVRLITTYAAALRWLTFEAANSARNYTPRPGGEWKPPAWRDGQTNVDERGEFHQIPVERRSIALISHDGKKNEMVDFINHKDHLKLLAAHDRILATGTTGWLLKLLFCEDISQYEGILGDKETRLCEVIADILKQRKIIPPQHAGLKQHLAELRRVAKTKVNSAFSQKVMPLPSGPDGGDVIAADQILDNKLHEVIFFQDPLHAHAHSDDIRLFERTSRLPGVYSECVSDTQSAHEWMAGLRKEIGGTPQLPTLAQRLRTAYALREVILVDTADNQDSDALGNQLARACGGFLNQWMHALDRIREARVGVAWGWGIRCVLNELKAMEREGLLQRPLSPRNVIWAPIIGIITAQMTDLEASIIADGFKSFYGGKLERLGCAGFAPTEGTIPADVLETVDKLEKSDLILTSGSGWDSEATLAHGTGLDRQKLPKFHTVAGTISGVFLDEQGNEVQGDYAIVGLGYRGLKTAAAEGNVVLVCGGAKRNKIVRAALKAGVVSVLISTTKTVEWILAEDHRAAVKARKDRAPRRAVRAT